jgi:hypothetical protein
MKKNKRANKCEERSQEKKLSEKRGIILYSSYWYIFFIFLDK